MLVEISIILLIFVLYFLFYVECKVNKNNKIFQYDKELTRQNINNEILLKMPFYFNGEHLNNEIKIQDYKMEEKHKDEKRKVYQILEDNIVLLKPYIKFDCSHKLHEIKKNGKYKIHKNNESINYYFVRSGSCEMFLVHPRFKENFQENDDSKSLESYIEGNQHFHNITCNKGNIIFVPNEWIVYIKNKNDEDCLIEKLSYSTIINKFMLYFKKNI